MVSDCCCEVLAHPATTMIAGTTVVVTKNDRLRMSDLQYAALVAAVIPWSGERAPFSIRKGCRIHT